MKTVLAALAAALIAGSLLAQSPHTLVYHGGPVIVTAKVVYIFWGPTFTNPASADHVYATTLQAFRNSFGTSATYNVITQYSGIMLSNLGAGTADWFDTSTPPTNVTDADVQAEVTTYLASHAFNGSTVYEVVLPSSSYSSSGGGTSCGGPNLQYCAYHSRFTSSGHDVKYAIQPYPSCSACQLSGKSTVQDQENFVCRDTLDTVTDPNFNAWYSLSGEVAAECGPPPPLSSAPCCVWSNKANACIC